MTSTDGNVYGAVITTKYRADNGCLKMNHNPRDPSNNWAMPRWPMPDDLATELEMNRNVF